jgi:hypothetical protein
MRQATSISLCSAATRPRNSFLSAGDWRRFRSDFLISPAQTQVSQLDERVTLGYRVEKNVGHAVWIQGRGAT